MDDAGYLGAASCRTSGIHHLDFGTGCCKVCRRQVLKVGQRRPATETAASPGVTKKGSPETTGSPSSSRR